MNSNIPYDLIATVLSGNATGSQIAELEEWRKITSENEEEFLRCLSTWNEFGTTQLNIDVNPELHWNEFEQLTSQPTKQTTVIRSLPLWTKIAASVVLIASIAGLLWMQNQTPQRIEFATQLQTDSLSLPDESKVWVNRSSKITYPKRFQREREIIFEGEAYFDIMRNPDKAFRVQTNSISVEVLGTEFNVRAFPHENKAEVVVFEGKVKVISPDGQTSIVLVNGETGIYDASKNVFTKTTEQIVNSISWKTSTLIFEDSRLNYVISQVEKRFAVAIEVDNPDILDCHFTSVFRSSSLETILEAIAFSLNLEIDDQGNQIKLIGKGCKE